MAKKPDIDVETISLNSEADRTTLKGFIAEAVANKKKVKFYNEGTADIRKEAKDKLGIPPKIFNKLVKDDMNGSFESSKRENEEYETIVEKLYPQSN